MADRIAFIYCWMWPNYRWQLTSNPNLAILLRPNLVSDYRTGDVRHCQLSDQCVQWVTRSSTGFACHLPCLPSCSKNQFGKKYFNHCNRVNNSKLFCNNDSLNIKLKIISISVLILLGERVSGEMTNTIFEMMSWVNRIWCFSTCHLPGKCSAQPANTMHHNTNHILIF